GRRRGLRGTPRPHRGLLRPDGGRRLGEADLRRSRGPDSPDGARRAGRDAERHPRLAPRRPARVPRAGRGLRHGRFRGGSGAARRRCGG
ncbi:MAG: Mg-protoporphyrin O-methyltransferase, partial [uncultured Gemmatimonadaceae bacterium]